MENLDIEISSTTLGNPNEQGGTTGAVTGLLTETLSKEQYTNIIVNNALKAEEITKENIPEATFGVSVLASAIKTEKMKELISSVDYPYLVKFNSDFLKEKIEKVKEEGYTGLGLGVALAQEYAYGLLQSHTAEQQKESTQNAVLNSTRDVVKIRTCIETVGLEEEIKKIREVNDKLQNNGKNIVWAIEPNKKVGDGTLVDFMSRYENIKNDPQNRNMNFGIDLDLGGLPQEENLFAILEILERNGENSLPLYLSLSGQEYTEGSVRTHLPLGENVDLSKKLGEWINSRQYQGKKIPALVVETSPTQNILTDYEKFLSSLKKSLTNH